MILFAPAERLRLSILTAVATLVAAPGLMGQTMVHIAQAGLLVEKLGDLAERAGGLGQTIIEQDCCMPGLTSVGTGIDLAGTSRGASAASSALAPSGPPPATRP